MSTCILHITPKAVARGKMGCFCAREAKKTGAGHKNGLLRAREAIMRRGQPDRRTFLFLSDSS